MVLGRNLHTMQLLVTAKSGLFKVARDSVEQLAKGDHFGCTWDDTFLYAFKRGGYGNTRVRKFSRDFTPHGFMYLDRSCRAHQSLYVPETKNFITVNTFGNELVLWKSPEKWERRKHITDVTGINYTEFTGDRYRDEKNKKVVGNHINTIHATADYYWTAHHNRQKRPPEIVQLDKQFKPIQSFKISDDKTDHIHNCWQNGDSIITLLSTGNSIVILNYKTDKKSVINLKEQTGLDLYLRGLAVTETRVYIGGAIKEKKHSIRYHIPMNYIYELDRDLNVLHVQSYRGVREIFDIRAIHSLDYAHNEIPF